MIVYCLITFIGMSVNLKELLKAVKIDEIFDIKRERKERYYMLSE